MGKYGPGVSVAGMCAMEREGLKYALNGKRWVGEDDSGCAEYEECSKEEAEVAALEIFDELSYQYQHSLAVSRAFENT